MARKVIAEFDAIDGPFINKLRAIDASVTRFETGTLSAFGRVEKGINGLLGSAARLQNISGLLAGGLGAGIATSYIDQATRIRRALKEAGDASQEGFEKAFQAAQRSLSGFEAFSQGVQRMRKATDGTFEDSVRNMETLNKLLVLGGKTTQERMSTMIQFSQALQANVLQGEELRSLRENAPIELITAIAREAGGTIEDLKEFGSQGKLTAEIMIRALKSLEAEADLRMRSVTLTISEAATVLANAGIVAVEGFDKGLGLSRATVGALTGLAGVLEESAEAAEMFGKAVQIAGGAMLATFAGGKINAAIQNTQAYGQSLRVAAAAAQKEAVATRLSANAAIENVGKKRSAMEALLRQQDTMVQAARTTALEEAKAATAARNAAEMRKADAAMNVASVKAEIAAMDQKIAKETRLRSLGFTGQNRRELYGDAAYTRRIGGMTEDEFQKTLAKRAELEQKLAAFDKQRAASQAALTAAVGKEAATRARLDTAGLQAVVDYDKKTKAQRARLARELASAENRVQIAMAAQTRAADAAAAASARLAFSARAVAAAGTLMRGAWAFLGGWPGLILTAGLAFLTLRGNVESAAERFDRLTSQTGEAQLAADRLREVQSRLNEAISESGKESDKAHQRIISNSRRELKAKRDLLALETKSIEQSQAERQMEVSRLEAEISRIYENAKAQIDAMSLSVFVDDVQVAQAMQDADDAAAGLRDKITELNANFVITEGIIEGNNALLAETAVHLSETERSVLSMVPGFESLSGQASAFAAWLAEAWGNADGVASTDMASGVAAAGEEARGLAGWLAAAYDRALAIAKQAADANARLAAMKFEFSPGGQALMKYGARGSTRGDRPIQDGRGFVLENGRFIDPAATGGGRRGGSGGGGRSRESDIDREALQFIESMMTAEEKRAAKLREITELRSQLVAKYGQEHEMVQRVDEAIERMNANMEQAKNVQEQFWDTMSDAIASSIEDWKGWGNFVRSVLSSFVRQHGEDFFIALFSPGKQSGNGKLGSFFGDLLTGQLHSGGGKGDRQARSVPAMAFMGAPRFHKGLMGLKSDEFTAILQDGETVLPRGVGLGGDRVTVVNNNDFRGVDASSRAYVEGKLKQLEQSIPARAVAAVQTAKRQRVMK